MSLRVVVYGVKGRHCESFKCEIKGTKGGKKVRIFVATMDTREEAEEAGRVFLETGQRPEEAKRGPKGPRSAQDVPRGLRGATPPPREQPQSRLPAESAHDRIALMKRIASKWGRRQ